MKQPAQHWHIRPTESVRGTIDVPGDKSISHRALMLGGLASGRSTISNFLNGDDCVATLAAMRALGVNIVAEESSLVIDGVGMHGLTAPRDALDLGNSGTAMRLLAGLLVAQKFDSVLTGDESLRARPMERIAKPLTALGARITTTDGHAPLRISGGRALRGIEYESPVASAQVKSAVLLAGLYAEGATTVISPGVTRDHTERMLRTMGAQVATDDDRRIVRVDRVESLKPIDLAIPGDFSSAAFFIVAACLGAAPSLQLRNVGMNPTRTGLLDILKAMGADIEVVRQPRVSDEPVADLIVRRSDLKGIDIPPQLVAAAIDEFPVIFIAAVGANGVTRISGAEELRLKESDRITTMVDGLSRLGAKVEELSDGARIHGGRLDGGTIDSLGDHRVAMSFAVASLLSDKPITIENTALVATSFPGFASTAESVGFHISSRGGS